MRNSFASGLVSSVLFLAACSPKAAEQQQTASSNATARPAAPGPSR